MRQSLSSVRLAVLAVACAGAALMTGCAQGGSRSTMGGSGSDPSADPLRSNTMGGVRRDPNTTGNTPIPGPNNPGGDQGGGSGGSGSGAQ